MERSPIREDRRPLSRSVDSLDTGGQTSLPSCTWPLTADCEGRTRHQSCDSLDMARTSTQEPLRSSSPSYQHSLSLPARPTRARSPGRAALARARSPGRAALALGRGLLEQALHLQR